ncbi:MAG: YlzJ-like family protein [Bacillota bacterium]
MVLYTVMPMEMVLEGMDQQRDWVETEYEGIIMQVEPLKLGEARVVRIFSTDPQDFLNPRYQPGAVINFLPGAHKTQSV